MLSNLRIEGMVAEDGPRLSGCCVWLESMLHPPRHRRSRKLYAPCNGTSGLGQVARGVHSVTGTCERATWSRLCAIRRRYCAPVSSAVVKAGSSERQVLLAWTRSQPLRRYAGRGTEANTDSVNHRGRARRSVSGPLTVIAPEPRASDHPESPRQTSTMRRRLALTVTATG